MTGETTVPTNDDPGVVPHVDPFAALLLAPLDDSQLLLVNLVADAFLREQRWPIFEYVEGELARQGLNAEEVLASLPRIKSGFTPGWTYGVAVNPRVRRSPDSMVILTLVGLSRAARAAGLVTAFLELLSSMAKSRAASSFSPYEVSKPTVPIPRLWGSRSHLSPETLAALVEVLGREPATVNSAAREENGRTVVDLRVTLLGYRDVSTIDDYVKRVVAHLRPEPQPRRVSYSSPYSLPSALDYLSVVWQTHFGEPLVTPPGFERSAKPLRHMNGPPRRAHKYWSRPR